MRCAPRYDYVFTTGGIGPTHDDITADAVAKAFGVGIGYHPEAYALLEARYRQGRIQRDAQAHGPHSRRRHPDQEQRLGRAGIPNRQCLRHGGRAHGDARHDGRNRCPRLPRGAPVQSITMSTALPEGTIAQGLADIQKAYPETAIGSYPWYRDGTFGAQLVVRSRDAAMAEAAAKDIEAMAVKLGAIPERV